MIRRQAIQNLFQWIQNKYGNIEKLLDASCTVLHRKDGQLTAADLQQLFRHEILALHIKNYLNPTHAQQLGEELSRSFVQNNASSLGHVKNWTTTHPEGYSVTSDVYTLGPHGPYNVAACTSDPTARRHAIDDYYKGVSVELKKRKRTVVPPSCTPALHPMDQLRLELDEVWPWGAGLLKEEHQGQYHPMGGGLPRIMVGPTRWRQGLIHVDEMAPLSHHHGLFSANIYLQLPTTKVQQQDGDLYIWPLTVMNKWDWYRNAHVLSKLSSSDASDQYELRKTLNQPVIVQLDPGDLLLLCVQRPHAAVGFEQGIRVSYQSFLQYNGAEQRILMEI